MSLDVNFVSPVNKYCTKLQPDDVVKDGFVFFCGRPANYLAYRTTSSFKREVPSIEDARDNNKKVCRDPLSFRPDPFKKLNKTMVYRAKFVFDSEQKLRYMCVFDEECNIIETYFYTPL